MMGYIPVLRILFIGVIINHFLANISLYYLVRALVGLSRNQKRIVEMLKIKPDMTTKEIAEMIFGKIVEYKSKEYASVHRSLISLEKQGYIKRVQVQLHWQKTSQTAENQVRN